MRLQQTGCVAKQQQDEQADRQTDAKGQCLHGPRGAISVAKEVKQGRPKTSDNDQQQQDDQGMHCAGFSGYSRTFG
jgi:hypothetical protein